MIPLAGRRGNFGTSYYTPRWQWLIAITILWAAALTRPLLFLWAFLHVLRAPALLVLALSTTPARGAIYPATNAPRLYGSGEIAHSSCGALFPTLNHIR